jgi:tripartite-type tricarboxylate transporter receptor subunit TctC
VARLNAVFVKAMRTPAVKERMGNLDLEIREMTPAQFGALVKSDYERWGPIIKASGFSGDAP